MAEPTPSYCSSYTQGHCVPAANDDNVCCIYDANARRYYNAGKMKADCNAMDMAWVPQSLCKVFR